MIASTEDGSQAARAHHTDRPALPTSEIRRVLPHRYPFLLVDRITAYEPGKGISGLKNFAEWEPMLWGPDRVISSVLGVEIIGQLAIAMFNLDRGNQAPADILLGSVSGVRLGADIPPGSQVTATAEVDKLLDNGLIFRGQAWTGGRLVLELDSLLAIEDPGASTTKEQS